MKRKPRPEKPERAIPQPRARLFRAKPQDCRPHVVQVFIAPTRRQMRALITRHEGDHQAAAVQGLVRSWFSKIDRRNVVRPGGVIARMYLNTADLRNRPGEIVSHECAHAAMAWARLRRANLRVMGSGPDDGEELLCHAVGRLVAQVNRIGYAAGVW